MCGPSAGTKLSGRCREVAVVERWLSVEVPLYLNDVFTKKKGGGSDFVTYVVVVMNKTILASFVFP